MFFFYFFKVGAVRNKRKIVQIKTKESIRLQTRRTKIPPRKFSSEQVGLSSERGAKGAR